MKNLKSNKIYLNDWKETPNLISIARLFLIIPSIFFFQDIEKNRWILVFIIILASVLDNLDGYIARKYDKITELGKVIDPIADKILVALFAFYLWVTGFIPSWFFIVIILRDIVILLGGAFALFKKFSVPASDFFGKLTVVAIGFCLILALLNFQKLENIYNLALYVTTFLSFLSIINYGIKGIKRNE